MNIQRRHLRMITSTLLNSGRRVDTSPEVLNLMKYAFKRSSGSYSTSSGSQNLTERQRKIMAQNLPKKKPITGVKKVILVSSGKGGVGKSTISVNLAVAMQMSHPDKKISLLDADVFGPSIPRMMNLNEEPLLSDSNLMLPLKNHGIKCMSLGFLVKDTSPVIWRGLMVMSAIEKLVRGVDWSESDILFVDMPPGTGDTQLSFAQSVEVDGAVIVTTPQQVAMQDAVKGVEMYRKTGVPVLGYVLNMASFICPSCKTPTPISRQNRDFGELSRTDLLGEVPFDLKISDSSDDGIPMVIADPSSPQVDVFQEVNKKLLEKLKLDK